MPPFLFDSWASLGSTALAGAIAYVLLVVLLRVSGKRTLAKMNAFDFVVTIAIGSTLASLFTARDLPVADGVLALALLIAFQYVVAWVSVRVGWFRHIVKSNPSAVFRDGAFLDDVLCRERLTRAEVLAAVRREGIDDLETVRIIVLETDGTVSVLPATDDAVDRSSAADVEGVEATGGGGGRA